MNLKIDIFVFQLKKITKEVTRKKGDKVFVGYKTETDNAILSEVYEAFRNHSKHEDITAFVDILINNFRSSFKINSDNTAAISIPEQERYISFSTKKNMLYGRFIGGRTGIERTVYDTKDALNKTGAVEKDSVTTLPFFFKIWLPKDVNYGVLMIQGYSNMSYGGLFLKQIESCFVSVGYKMFYKKYILMSLRKKFLEHSVLNRIKIEHAKIDEDSGFSPKLKPLKSSKRVMTIDKFAILFADFVAPENYLVDFTDAIKELDKNYDCEKDKVTLHYSLEDGSNASASLSNLDAIFPPLYIGQEFIDVTTNLPIWEKLETYTDSLLDEIKAEYKYIPKDV